MKIGVYSGSWAPNIGNAFFDYGAKQICKMAFPNAEIIPIGGAVHWMFSSINNDNGLTRKALRKLLELFNLYKIKRNSIEIGEIAQLDIIVVPGMCIADEFVRINAHTLLVANESGIPILFLGAGAYEYTEREREIYSKFLGKLKKFAMITRDDDTFAQYSPYIEKITRGIDCAFFLPDYFQPPSLQLSSFDVENFDSLKKIPDINHKGNEIVYTHHSFWKGIERRHLGKPRTLISDIPEDYLTLYANAQTTYSDRVHACLAAVAYGNSARFYGDTPRQSLFKRVGIPNISIEVSKIDMVMLDDLKFQQVQSVRQLINQLVM